MFLNSYITMPETFPAQEVVLRLLCPRCRLSECRTFSIVFNVKHVVMTCKGGTTTGAWKTKGMVKTLTNNRFSTREVLQAHRERTGMTGWRFILENIEMSFMGASFLVRGLLHILDDDYSHFDVLFFHSTPHCVTDLVFSFPTPWYGCRFEAHPGRSLGHTFSFQCFQGYRCLVS